MTNTVNCGQKDALVSYLYNEGDAAERERFETHLAECAACRGELETLRALRIGLAVWSPPERELDFTIVSRAEVATPARRWAMPAWGLAAAAGLVLAASAAIANLEVRYGTDGLTVRTGWGRDGALGPQPAPSAREAAREATPWRTELTALERRLRREFSDAVPSASVRPGAARAAAPASADLLRRVETLIGESESRQQRELALRLAQVLRDFDRQRQADLVSIRQGFGQLAGTTAADRELLNYLVRVSQQR